MVILKSRRTECESMKNRMNNRKRHETRWVVVTHILFTVKASPFILTFCIQNELTSPQVGFEPTTSQLTADRSTTELLRNRRLDLIESIPVLNPTHSVIEASFVTPRRFYLIVSFPMLISLGNSNQKVDLFHSKKPSISKLSF